MRREDRHIVDRNELIDILERADVAHLAMIEEGTPYLVTMNYGFLWESELPTLYFHCAKEGRKLDTLRKNPLVCFSVDTDHELVTGAQACDFGMKYRSIVGMGSIGIVEDAEDLRVGLDCIMAHYAGAKSFSYNAQVLKRTAVLKLAVSSLDGKKKI